MLYPGHFLFPNPSVNIATAWATGCFMGKRIFLCFYASASAGSVINMSPFLWKRTWTPPSTLKFIPYPGLFFFFFPKISHHLPNCLVQKPQNYSCPLSLPKLHKTIDHENPLKVTPAVSLKLSISLFADFVLEIILPSFLSVPWKQSDWPLCPNAKYYAH